MRTGRARGETEARAWRLVALLPLVLLLGMGMGMGGGGVLAQDEVTVDGTPAADEGRPAHVHTGSCNDGGTEELGDIVQTLTSVLLPVGAGAGQEDRASGVETSLTVIPVSLDALLAEDHVVDVHLSVDEIETGVVCGEIGGVVSPEDGSLVIGLREQDGSGFVGVAYLGPGFEDPSATVISLFLAEGLAAGTALDEGAAEEGAGADEDAGESEDSATPTS